MARWLGLVLVLSAGAAACDRFTGSECTLDLRPALAVEVRDSVTSAAAGQGARLIATDGVYADTAQFEGPFGGPYRLADERAGTYTVTVEQEGYRLWSRSGIRVTRDECHVRTVSLTARLQR
jgi:hypothetical protein